MAEASLTFIAESLSKKLGSYVFEKIKLLWRARDDLRKLVSTIDFIKAGLLDAERRQNEGELIKTWLRRLRYVLYDADDLFDRVFTIEGGQQKLTGNDWLVEEVKQFFSKYNHVVLRAKIAWKVKEIREELDGIKSDMANFAFNCNLMENSLCYEHESTGPIKAADEIIGREKEEKELVRILLDDTRKQEGLADVIAIVGFGGLGKTTLAQLLYSSKHVKAKFELHAWACISDTKGRTSKARIILGALQIAESIGSTERSNRINVHEIQVDELEQEIQERVRNKKYLLVVDDYWDEDRKTWSYLMGLLRGGKEGSKIIVTTRSSKIALAVGVDSPHLLKGLKDDKAWELFKKLAFRSATDAENQRLIVMGKKIVQKCKNVPLAIRAIASVLYTCCDDERMWRSIADSDMLTLEREYQDLNILPVLKLSYHHLPSHLKHCFAFCSVFPKDYEIDGEKLIYYWISQGYVERRCGTSGLMQIGESYLKELVARSFLQGHQVDRWGRGRGRYGNYKMHDLMHDLAMEVAGEEVLCIESSNNRPGHIGENQQDHASNSVRIRHLSLISNQNQQTFDDVLQSEREKYLRSLIFTNSVGSTISLKELSHLRLLEMASMRILYLCGSIGEMKHLRSLILSDNYFGDLPEEICKLQNLKILDVSRCVLLKTLPCNLSKLINLTCLRVGECISLRGMPCEFGGFLSLESLDEFIIGEISSEYSGLEELAGLVNLRSERLAIRFQEMGGGLVRKNIDGQKRVDLSSSLIHLDQLSIKWPNLLSENQSGSWACESECDMEGVEFQFSKLPSNLKILDIHYFPRQVIPESKDFNYLLEVYLSKCKKCRYLPSFGEQPRLKVLHLYELDELEYIQMGSENDELAVETHCLVRLDIYYLPKLKAWSPGMEKLAHQHISSSPHDAIAAFPHFQSLTGFRIMRCNELMSMPIPPKDMPCYGFARLKEPLESMMEENGNSWRRF